MSADFFANAPPSTGTPYREPREVEAECRFLATARFVAARCLKLDAAGWTALPEFNELCALLAVDTDPAAPGATLPDVPRGWRYLRPGERIERNDQWQPLRRRPSKKGNLRLPFETVQPALVGKTLEEVRQMGLTSKFIRAVGKEGEGKREGAAP